MSVVCSSICVVLCWGLGLSPAGTSSTRQSAAGPHSALTAPTGISGTTLPATSPLDFIDKAKRGLEKGAKGAEKGIKKGAKKTEEGIDKGAKRVKKALD